jgi:Mn2+/Fe2+ NRAMP family transporter
MPPRRRLAVLAAVVGPGLLAGLSDDDPARITTYSVLGADHRYRLLWVLLLSTYGTYAVVITLSAALVLLPGAPLVSILVLTQIVNAVLLLPLLGFMYGIARNAALMGDHVASRPAAAGYLVAIAFIAVLRGLRNVTFVPTQIRP